MARVAISIVEIRVCVCQLRIEIRLYVAILEFNQNVKEWCLGVQDVVCELYCRVDGADVLSKEERHHLYTVPSVKG